MRAFVHDIDALSPAQIARWDGIVATLPVPSPFLSHSFCRAAHDVRGGGRVLEIETGDGEFGFLPFQIRKGRGLLGHAEKPAGSLSDMFGIVGTIRSRLDARHLLRAAGISSLRFDHAVPDLCPFPFLDRKLTSGVRVRIDDYSRYMGALAAREKDFVKTVARAERKLAREIGTLSFTWHAVDSHVELDRVIALKRQQFQRTGMPDGLKAAWRRRMLHRLLQEPAASLCRPVVSTLHCGGVWIASNVSLACGDTLHIWFPSYDPQFRRYGPGHILFFKLFEEGRSRAFRWFDFGEGEAVYKSRYGGEEYPLWKGAIRRRSLFGCSEPLLQSLEWRTQKWKFGRRPRPAEAR